MQDGDLMDSGNKANRIRDKVREKAHGCRYAVGVFCFTAGLVLFFVGFAVVAYECFFWLTTGMFLEIPTWKAFQFVGIDAFSVFSISWKGVEDIIFWIIRQSLAVVSIWVGCISFCTAFSIW
jgi:hypothetical protein